MYMHLPQDLPTTLFATFYPPPLNHLKLGMPENYYENRHESFTKVADADATAVDPLDA